MPTVTKICKVCGKEYPYCKTDRPGGMFRWQDVACSPECGAEYFRLVAISRGELAEEHPAEETPTDVKDDFDDEPMRLEETNTKTTRQSKKKKH